MSKILKSSSGRLKHMAAGVASGAAAGFVLNPLLLPAGAIAGGFYGNKVYCENAAKQMRIKELGVRFDTEGTECASCGAPKAKKGGLGNCYGCGKLFCTKCREKSSAFKVEEEEFSVNLKVCDSCHEDLQCITMSDADLGDDGSEPSTPLYDFSSFQATSSAPVPSVFDGGAAPPAQPAAAAAPAYASGLGRVPAYASGGSFHTFDTPVASAPPAASPSAPGLYPSLDSEPSAPLDEYGMSSVQMIPNLSDGTGDRLERVMTAASFFPEAPEGELPVPAHAPSAPSAEGDVRAQVSVSTLVLDTNSGPELQFACEQVAAAAAEAEERSDEGPLASAPAAGSVDGPSQTPCDDDEKKDWEASWDLPPAVLAQRAMEKLKLSEGSSVGDVPPAETSEPETNPASPPPAPVASVASLFPTAPDHDIAT